ncbi:MAG: hypothetical protein AB7K09_11110 [Planctomycetota bacterium]
MSFMHWILAGDFIVDGSGLPSRSTRGFETLTPVNLDVFNAVVKQYVPEIEDPVAAADSVGVSISEHGYIATTWLATTALRVLADYASMSGAQIVDNNSLRILSPAYLRELADSNEHDDKLGVPRGYRKGRTQ